MSKSAAGRWSGDPERKRRWVGTVKGQRNKIRYIQKRQMKGYV